MCFLDKIRLTSTVSVASNGNLIALVQFYVLSSFSLCNYVFFHHGFVYMDVTLLSVGAQRKWGDKLIKMFF